MPVKMAYGEDREEDAGQDGEYGYAGQKLDCRKAAGPRLCV